MITYIDVQVKEHAQKLLALQIPSYRVEAKLIGFDGIPPLHDTTESLQGCGETFFVYELEGQLAGAISYERDGDEVTICRMMVHPDYFRRGIAGKLLRHVQEVEARTQRFLVSTGSANEPALALYGRDGFQVTSEREVAPGIWLTFLAKVTPFLGR
ncbi:GNAT family N-acetyltransferase [Tumebacillus permanentifrigoris]|uniref:Acetyltransferase (GNAT) family protein n=1 Tax=Tumebacillus permanentifrigoris TaxID=378543 RepID=A0A316DE48_9BACL|nr:GNAT family N-acetyltransferase [Tumebacillus permanentifrigoris]PWK15802.1 acetyltransferase (GNAT) family protein [Tumebacillus permanentifrigoris]